MLKRIWIFFAVVLVLGACAQAGTGRYRPDLNGDIIARIALGQSEQEVAAILGPPYQRIRFDNLKSTAWDYLYRDTWGYWVEYSVMVGNDGRVVDRVSRRIDPVDRR